MSIIKKKITVIKKSGSELEKEIREKTVGYIVAGFSVVAGLAWNEAIKAMIEDFFPIPRDTVRAKFFYAAIVTAILVAISLYLVKFFKNSEKEAVKIEEEMKEESKIKK